jgi:hypothetical protein
MGQILSMYDLLTPEARHSLKPLVQEVDSLGPGCLELLAWIALTRLEFMTQREMRLKHGGIARQSD